MIYFRDSRYSSKHFLLPVRSFVTHTRWHRGRIPRPRIFSIFITVTLLDDQLTASRINRKTALALLHLTSTFKRSSSRNYLFVHCLRSSLDSNDNSINIMNDTIGCEIRKQGTCNENGAHIE